MKSSGQLLMDNAAKNPMGMKGWEQLLIPDCEEEKKDPNPIPVLVRENQKKVRLLIKKALLEGRKISDLYTEISGTDLLKFANKDKHMAIAAFYEISKSVKREMGFVDKRRKQISDFIKMYSFGYRRGKIMRDLGLSDVQYEYLYERYRLVWKNGNE